MIRERLVSGIRSTGDLHLGNYYGALSGLQQLQERFDARYFIADIHSLTTHPGSDSLHGLVVETAKTYLAAGLDPQRCTLYVQSSLAAEVCELHMYLSMVMPLGELLRVPTFKEKAKRHPDNVNYGLVGYPVLMAADILLHRGQHVPVGEDQLVHLEIARTIARKFNALYGELFPDPQPVAANAARVPSLAGGGKMSKSDAGDSCIVLDDDTRMIRGKLRKAYSDPQRVYLHEPGHPTKDGCNVFHLHTFFTPPSRTEELAGLCAGAAIGCVACKSELAESVDAIVAPFRQRRAALDEADVREALRIGKEKAKSAAGMLLAEVRKAIGLYMV